MSVQKVISLLRRDTLLYVVFFTGAVVLAVEVMAVRILSPYFGNTIFSFSSIISVILAALSVGYWRGGRMADRFPETKYFYNLVSRAGWVLLVVQIVSAFVLPFIAMLFSLVVGPLIAALILFFYPSYLFGLLSPYVIKLRSVALPERGVGAVSGEVFFASTVGSIFGSLLSGFVLIPHVGISISMFTMAILVIVVGLVGSRLLRSVFNVCIFILTILFVLVINYILQTNSPFSLPDTLVYQQDGVYEQISVIETDRLYGKHARVLVLDRTFSSGVTLPDGDLLFPYTKYYRLYRYFHPTLERALVLGAGTGTIARELNKDYPDAIIDIVDIEPRLFALAHKYFFLPETSNIVAHVADGRQYLRANNTEYDFIFGDMYASLHSIPWHVSTREYYELLHSRLRENGVYVGNYITSIDNDAPSLFGSTLRTIHDVFGNATVFAVQFPESASIQNIMILATKGAMSTQLVRTDLRKADDVEIRQFADHLITYDAESLSKFLQFTDDRAPVELYSMSNFSES